MKKYGLKLISVILCMTVLPTILGGCQIRKSNNEYTDTRFLMDTVCTIRVGGENAREAVNAAFERAEEIAGRSDYFSDESEVAKINKASAGEAVRVSDDIAEILRTALEIYKSSDGAFDITVAPIKDLWRFSDGAHEPPQESEIKTALEKVGSKQIVLNENIVTKTAGGVKIDLGGAAKGYASDCAREVLGEYNVDYALIDFGGSIAAMGKNPSRSDGEWTVGIQKPFGKNGEYTKVISVSEKAVVTSGTYQRFFEWNGKIYHHIIDPKTGCPSESGISGVSIICDSALLADCLATAYLVMGRERGESLIRQYSAAADGVE